MTTPPTPSYREIPLTRNQVTLVDERDFESLNAYKWHAAWYAHTQSFYAQRNERGTCGRRRRVAMQRSVLGLDFGDRRLADHIDGNTLDNRRSNLRIVTPSQNAINSRERKNNTTGFRGVYRDRNLFQAKIRSKGKLLFLGMRSTAKAAYEELYLPAIEKHYGEFARKP